MEHRQIGLAASVHARRGRIWWNLDQFHNEHSSGAGSAERRVEASSSNKRTALTLSRTHARNQTPPDDARRILPSGRHPLACMGKLSTSTSEPVAADHRRRPDRSRNSAHQHARSDLHRRLLRHQRQLRGRGHLVHALPFRLRVSDSRKVNVLILRRALGYDYLDTLRCRPGASTSAVLLLWE